MSYLGDNLGRAFLGSTAIHAAFPLISGAPLAIPLGNWSVANNDGAMELTLNPGSVAANVDTVYFRAGSLNEPWQPLGSSAGTYDLSVYPFPEGVPIKVWVATENENGFVYNDADYHTVTLDAAAPTISVGTPIVTSSTVTVGWTTSHGDGTGFVLIDQSASRTGAQIETGAQDSTAVSSSGGQDNLYVPGLSPETSYYVHVVHKNAAGEYSNVVSQQVMTEAVPTGTLVSSYEEAVAARDAGDSVILVAGGTYNYNGGTGWLVFFKNLDRTGNPLTVQGADPENPPFFRNQAFNFGGAKHITLKDVKIGPGAGSSWDEQAAMVNDNNGPACNDLTFDNVWLTNEANFTGDINSNVDDPDFGRTSLARGFVFKQPGTHNITIKNCPIDYIYYNDIMMNGSIRIENNILNYWYFDGFRLLAAYDSHRVDGDKVVGNNVIAKCIGRYNEISVSEKKPHPDVFQIFSGGADGIDDLLFYQNISPNGTHRGVNVQRGLCQTRMRHVAYVEEMSLTRGNVHGISIEDGSDSTLIERCTLADSSANKTNVGIRAFECNGQFMVVDTIYGAMTLGSGNDANGPRFELEQINSPIGLDYGSLFVGGYNPSTEAEARACFTPTSDLNGRGALNTSGQFRNKPHRPLRAKAPSLTPIGSGNVRIDTIREPTLMSPKQVAQGGTNYTRRDIRWSATGNANTWTTEDNVNANDVIPVPTGSKIFQTRLWIADGPGLWSKDAQIVVT